VARGQQRLRRQKGIESSEKDPFWGRKKKEKKQKKRRGLNSSGKAARELGGGKSFVNH